MDVRLTVEIDPHVLAEAERLTGVTDRSALVREGLRVLIERETARRLAQLGGTQPNLGPIQRRR